ncbi:MAG: SAM-dependent methyltransferase [Flavobacteriales bacterium]|nr:SAM-dependent methyltransferase [Flavobacteriales bacterium]
MNYYLCENVRSARRFIKSLCPEKSIDDCEFLLVDKRTKVEELYLDLTKIGNNIGLLSEAGYPSVADPGFIAVSAAHELGFNVKPLIGPSSIMLALAASGMNGQQFVFHGYLPIKSHDRKSFLKKIQSEILRNSYSHIFIETPFRNNQLIEDILNTCKTDLKLSVSVDLTMKTEEISTLRISEWKGRKKNFHKRPAIFVLGK